MRPILLCLLATLVACDPPSHLVASGWQPPVLELSPPQACGASRASTLRPRGEVGASGPLALATWSGRAVALVADADEAAVHVVDTESMAWLSTTELAARPAHLRVLDDGRVALTLRSANRVVIAEAGPRPEDGLEPRCDAAGVREPIALAEREGELLVVGGAGAELIRVGLHDLAVRGRIRLPREPRNLLVTGDVAWVISMVEGILARVDLEGGEMTRQTLHQRVRPPFSRDVVDAASSQGFALAATDERLFAPLVASLPPDPERDRLRRYYGGTDRTFNPFVAAVDRSSGRPLAIGRESPSEWRRPCMLPRAAAVAGERLLVACLDEGTVLELDARFLDPMVGLYRQLRVADGPTGLAVDGSAAFVWSLHGHALSRFAVGRPVDVEVPVVELTLPRRPDTAWPAERRRGRALFVARRDPRLSRTGVACASCHPDGRDDGLTWGTETSTKSLAGLLEGTAPYGWRGSAESLHERVQSTALRLQGKGFRQRDESDRDALVGYLEAMDPPPPPLPQGRMGREAIARGERLFREELACASCHPGGGTRGGKLPIEDEGIFDTPSLAYVGLTAPYFHDHRYDSLDALLQDPAEPMDQTASLSVAQRSDLVAYLESLPHGAVTAPPPVETSWAAGDWGAAHRVTRDDGGVRGGRHLAAAPQRIDVSTFPVLPLPETRGDGVVWLSLRNVEGLTLGTSNAVNHYAPEEPTEAIRFLASAEGQDAIEVQVCDVTGQTFSFYGGAVWGILCPERGARAGVALGTFGPAARGRWAGHDVLFVAGPDTWENHQAGDLDDLGNEDRGWMDIHALRLEPGHHAELVRLGYESAFWERAVFETGGESTIVSVSWPEGAPAPTVLVAPLREG